MFYCFSLYALYSYLPTDSVYPRAIIMSVIAIVQRALPFSLPWKRRQSTSKEKDPELKSPDQESHEEPPPGNQSAEYPCTTLQCDVLDALHIAVRQPRDQNTNSGASSSETDSGSESEHQTHRLSDRTACAREQFSRAVSWASIIRNQCRWTKKQEKQLVMAEKQLKRCQKAWSSEQEVWLAYIKTLSEEKEAHEDFMLMRMRQQEEERNQFRKSWKRRRSVESALEEEQDVSPNRSNATGLDKLRRLPQYRNLASNLATESTAVACRG
ncbi:uncharacterized protein N7498_003571 [Penicillium cinerascens]|uniref:Uncharacterized protein n=1 Tax=Penicillium cinerascens TaxID=70096 RepID=A0A9W9T809_9EURO|nr:uncharacterized protein N7498_003571 [Penicillium cinerascens]KAJ5211925.1 hypothetical protein N7498_003571 [Penicillium cinerascens]